MEEFIDVIFTHEFGQVSTTVPLESMPNLFSSKMEMERQLLLFWQVINNSQHILMGRRKPSGLKKLVKISTCIISDEMKVPSWYGEWDGKFYYEDGI